jgi:hypothetical protein
MFNPVWSKNSNTLVSSVLKGTCFLVISHNSEDRYPYLVTLMVLVKGAELQREYKDLADRLPRAICEAWLNWKESHTAAT